MTTLTRVHRDAHGIRFSDDQIADILRRYINEEPTHRIAWRYGVIRRQINDAVNKHGRCSLLRRKRGTQRGVEVPPPSEDEIRELCAAIQARWTEEERAQRAGALGPRGVEELEPVSIGD